MSGIVDNRGGTVERTTCDYNGQTDMPCMRTPGSSRITFDVFELTGDFDISTWLKSSDGNMW
eukprot:SAG22_NODE_16626_length_321_cov_0.923423_1_plen_61_part_10